MRFTKRIAAISVAFLLFCAVVVAQNENASNQKNKNFGVKLTTNSIRLKPGMEKTLPIMLLDGYHKPLLIYAKYYINSSNVIKEKNFFARIEKKGENYSLIIKAAEDIKQTELDTIYVRSMEKNPKRPVRKDSQQYRKTPYTFSDLDKTTLGVPLIITYTTK